MTPVRQEAGSGAKPRTTTGRKAGSRAAATAKATERRGSQAAKATPARKQTGSRAGGASHVAQVRLQARTPWSSLPPTASRRRCPLSLSCSSRERQVPMSLTSGSDRILGSGSIQSHRLPVDLLPVHPVLPGPRSTRNSSPTTSTNVNGRWRRIRHAGGYTCVHGCPVARSGRAGHRQLLSELCLDHPVRAAAVPRRARVRLPRAAVRAVRRSRPGRGTPAGRHAGHQVPPPPP